MPNRHHQMRRQLQLTFFRETNGNLLYWRRGRSKSGWVGATQAEDKFRRIEGYIYRKVSTIYPLYQRAIHSISIQLL